jgi:hypothetical protein
MDTSTYSCYQHKHIMSLVPLANEETEILELMQEIGGSFIVHLTRLWFHADMSNRRIIRHAFDHEFQKYDRLVTMRKQHTRTHEDA